MNLGEKLKQQNYEREQASIARKRAIDEAALRKVKQEEDEIRSFNLVVIENISKAIDKGFPIPSVIAPKKLFPAHLFTLDEYGLPKGHPHWPIVHELRQWGTENGLDIRFVHAHDGMGYESWLEIKVQPL